MKDRRSAARLPSGQVGEPEIRALARRVARFHAETEQAPPGSFGPSQVADEVLGNFVTLLAGADTLGHGRLAAAHRFATSFLHGRTGLFEERAAAGHVRDCHGDLRLEHVVLQGDEIAIFDPVEFDPALRQIDVAADLAFLVMELAEAGRDDLAGALVEEYRESGGDPGGDELVSFYAAYRAWVRAKIAFLRGGRLDRVRTLAKLGERFAWRARGPLLIVVCGAAATGKTRLAETLASAAGLPHLSSDVVRKELWGLAPSERAPSAAYSEEASLRTYEELGARVRGGAVVDATFRLRSHRAAFAAGRAGDGPAPVFAECRAPAAVVAERALEREREPGRVSDATAAIAARQRSEFEPLDEVDPGRHVALRTDREPAEAIDDLVALLDARLARGG